MEMSLMDNMHAKAEIPLETWLLGCFSKLFVFNKKSSCNLEQSIVGKDLLILRLLMLFQLKSSPNCFFASGKSLKD